MFQELRKPMQIWLGGKHSFYPLENDELVIKKYGYRTLCIIKQIATEYAYPKVADIVSKYKNLNAGNSVNNYVSNYSVMLLEIKNRLDSEFLQKYPKTDKIVLNQLFSLYSYYNFYA